MRKLLLLTALFICCFKFGYAQPGSIDASFGNKGTVRTDAGSDMVYASSAKQVLLQSDGSIYVIFESSGVTLIAKKRPDGSPDSSYGSKGFSVSVAINNAHAALQKDGKIIVAGRVKAIYSNNSGNYDFALARYNTDGSLDLAFDKDGKVTTDFNNYDDGVNSIAIQNDGKIVVAGFTSIPDDYNIKVVLARYNIDGSPDLTFDEDGRLKTQLQSNSDRSNLAAIQID